VKPTSARGGTRRGSSLVEFALSATLLFPALIGTFQIGYSLFVYNRLESAVRNGARYAALRAYDSATATPSAAFTTAVQNMVVYGSPSAGSSVVVPGLTTDKVSVSVSMVSGTPDVMKVSIATFTIDAALMSFTITGKPFASYRFQGRFAPP